MRPIAEITGQDIVTARIAKLLTSANGGRIAAIIGPEGSGKSRCAAMVAEKLHEDYRVVLRQGEALLSGAPEAMLTSSPRITAEQTGGFVLDIGEDVADLLAKGHIPFSRTLQRLFKLKSELTKKKQLTERQKSFLFELAFLRSGKPALFIADNLHYWDKDSLNFLAQIHQGLLDSLYPNLPRIRIILVWTPEHAESGFEAEIKHLFSRTLTIEELRRVDKSVFRELLLTLGAPQKIPHDLLEQIYAVSGGHLLFASQIVKLMSIGSVDTVTESAQIADFSTALKNTIEARLDAAGAIGQILRRLIQALSIIGDVARLHDLACILPEDRESLESILEQATRLGFIERSTEEIRLVHEVIRRVFLSFLTPNQRDWHQRFANCLAMLRPWDYARRSLHCTAAGDEVTAEVMRVMGLLQGVREMRILPEDNWSLITQPLSQPISVFLGSLRRSAAAEHDRRYDVAIMELESVPTGIPALLSTEKDLVLARLLLLKRTNAAYMRALALLDDLDPSSAEEPDLRIRAEELRIVLLAHMDRLQEAREVELSLRNFLHQRHIFDPTALRVENRLRRKSESLHSPLIANDKLRKALAYYDPAGDGSSPRDIVEYLLTLNNLGANELVIGKFDNAFERFARCYKVIENSRFPVVKRVEIVLSNLIIAHFLLTGVVPDSITTLTDLTNEMDPLSSDGAVIRSNIAALLASKGSLKEAHTVLERVAKKLLSVIDFNHYYIYYVFSNLAVVEWLLDANSAADSFEQAKLSLEGMEPNFKPYASRRLTILEKAFAQNGERDLSTLAAVFSSRGPQVGEGWHLYGRVLAVTDLQFWTEN